MPLPRRCLSLMVGLWGFGTLPFGLVATADSFWAMALCLAAAGPVARVVALPVIFWTVALLTSALGLGALRAGRMREDELAHPLAG